MNDYFKKYPALKYNVPIDISLNIPNSFFQLYDASSASVYSKDIKIMNDDFRYDLYTDDKGNVYSLWLSYRIDYRNYFLYLIKNNNTSKPTLLTITAHRPRIQLGDFNDLKTIAIYDRNLDKDFLRQYVIIEFDQLRIIYTKPIINPHIITGA